MSGSAIESDLIIVSGLPRSGTSMMMRMLEAGGLPVLTDNLRQADADNPNGYYEFEPVKKVKTDASWIADAKGMVVKMVYALLYDLPEDYRYHAVFMRRDLDEIVASQDVMLERKGEQQTGLDSTTVKRVFQKQLSDFFNWLEQRNNFSLLQIDYNEVLRDPIGPITKVNEFLGGQLDAKAMSDIIDPGLYRNRGEG